MQSAMRRCDSVIERYVAAAVLLHLCSVPAKKKIAAIRRKMRKNTTFAEMIRRVFATAYAPCPGLRQKITLSFSSRLPGFALNHRSARQFDNL
jgi:hypothetical protein